MSLTIYANTGYAGGAFNPSSFPALLAVDTDAETAVLTWAPVRGAVGYAVYAGVREDDMLPIAIEQLDTTLELGSLALPGYAFKIVADMGNGRSMSSFLLRSGSGGIPEVTAGPNPGQITLSFTPLLGAVGYNVYVGTASGGENPVPILQTHVPGQVWAQPITNGFIVNGLTNGTEYFFMVQPIFEGWLGECVEVSGTPFLAPPTSLTAMACDGHVNLSWGASEQADTYSIYQGTTPGGEGGSPVQSGITALSTIINGLTNGTTYYFKASAVGALGESNKSNEASSMPVALGAPSALTATADAQNGDIALAWTAGANAGSYNILRGTTSGGESVYKTGITVTVYNDVDAVPGVLYYYKIQSVNACGQTSAASNESSVQISAYDAAMYALGPSIFAPGSGPPAGYSIVGGVTAGASLLSNDGEGSLVFDGGTGVLKSTTLLTTLVDNFSIFSWTLAAVGGGSVPIFSVAQGTPFGTHGLTAIQSGATVSFGQFGGPPPGATSASGASSTSQRSFSVFQYKQGALARVISNGVDQTASSDATGTFGVSAATPPASLIGGSSDGADFGFFSGTMQKFAVVMSTNISVADIQNLYAIGIGGGNGFTEAQNVTAISTLSLTNKNRTATKTPGSGNYSFAKSLYNVPSSAVYAEAVNVSEGGVSANTFSAGISLFGYLDSAHWIGGSSGGIGYGSNGILSINGAGTTGLPPVAQGSVLGIYLDVPNGKGWFAIDNVVVSGNPQTGSAPMFTFDPSTMYYIAAAIGDVGGVITLNLDAANLAHPSQGRFSAMLP